MKTLGCIIPFGILVDIISKYFAGMYLQEKVHILGDFLYLQFVKNDGIAFSFPLSGFLLKIVTIVLIIGIAIYYFLEEKKKNSLLIDSAFALVLSGAIGNGFERIFFGEVIDFIGVKYFAVFNIADSMICVGAFLYIVHLYLEHKKDG